MSSIYEIWLTTDTGDRIILLNNFLTLSASKLTNGLGYFNLFVPSTFDTSLIQRDRMIQVWRQPENGILKLWQVYLLRRWRFKLEDGREIIKLEGPDTNDLLRRRIVAHYSGTSQASKTDFADDMMKEVVTQAIADGTNPAPTAGTRVWSRLSVAADVSLGPTISKDFPFEYLITKSGSGILPSLAKAAREAGTEVFFNIEPIITQDGIEFEFRTYTGQPGIDVSDSVKLNDEAGTLKNPELEYDYTEEENYIYAGGQGEGQNRNIQQVSDSDRYSASIWNRCEGFADARDQTSDDGVREAGRSQLEDGRGRIRFTSSIVNTQQIQFGKDWDFGYRVTAKFQNQEFACIVRAVVLSVNNKGYENIQARLDFESLL